MINLRSIRRAMVCALDANNRTQAAVVDRGKSMPRNNRRGFDVSLMSNGDVDKRQLFCRDQADRFTPIEKRSDSPSVTMTSTSESGE